MFQKVRNASFRSFSSIQNYFIILHYLHYKNVKSCEFGH